MTLREGAGGLSALPVCTTGPSGNSGKSLESERFRGIMETSCNPPQAGAYALRPGRPHSSRPGSTLTSDRQGAAVPLVEVAPGPGLAVLAAGEDPVAAGAGHQAHTDRAAALGAELEEGNPAREPRGQSGRARPLRPTVPTRGGAGARPTIHHAGWLLTCGQRPEVLSRDVQHRAISNRKHTLWPEATRAG